MKLRRRLLSGLLVISCVIFMPFALQMRKPLPDGISFAGGQHPVSEIEFIGDLTYVDPNGVRHVEQRIFDELLQLIGSARRLIVLDMFLYNPFQGPVVETTRRLSEELTNALLARKRALPDLPIVVITDPINTVYGGMESAQFERLRESGIEVVETRLVVLRDSNPIYSLFWRLFVRPFGNGDGEALPNPFGSGRVSIRSYLRLLNFKANHRKVLIADADDRLVGFVTSANPHDGSSAHTNVAIKFDGPAVLDLLESENAVLTFSERARIDVPQLPSQGGTPITVQVLTEKRIKDTVMDTLDRASAGDRLNLAMFYLSDRDIVAALVRARQRGAELRVLLDPNRDAFGRRKNGIPGRPVAYELQREGVPVRWCDTHGEQCHMKLLLADYRDGSSVLLAGSANFTRRNLENFNLETNVAVRGPSDSEVFQEARSFFRLYWSNDTDRRFSTEYAALADESLWKRFLYQLMERSGISTF